MNGATNRHTSLTPLLNKEGQGEVLHHKRVSLRIPVFCLSVFLTAMSCINTPLPNTGILNPFTELPAITPDGTPHDLTANIVPLGPLERNDVIRIDASGPNIVAVFILIRDDLQHATGVIVGGGPANTPFQYRIQTDNDYYVFIQFSATATALQRTGTIAVAPGDPTYRPPSQQRVLITFEQGYLHSPGLYDPDSDPPENQTLLASISDTVRHEVIRKLRTIFADTPIQIVSEDDPAPAEPFSRVTFSPKRILAPEQDVTDNRLPPPDSALQPCLGRVVFGELLPTGSFTDTGNHKQNDEAIVYVGSFQGRGQGCQTAITNSVNEIVKSLAQTAAHEIGHLVGLLHVEQIDIMNRTATLAFLRDLPFDRAQIQIDRNINGDITSEVVTSVIQEPRVYFEGVFDRQE